MVTLPGGNPFDPNGSCGGGQPMGLGHIGDQGLIFKRKFRWTFSVTGTCVGDISESFVKTAKRPNLQIEEKEIHFLHGVTWIPGKAKWQEMEVVYFDVNKTDTQKLYAWIASVYNIMDPTCLKMNSRYTGTGILTLFDGCGAMMERWTLNSLWPKNIDFGDLDYTSSDECNITVTFRYTSVNYENTCPGIQQPCDCVGCA